MRIPQWLGLVTLGGVLVLGALPAAGGHGPDWTVLTIGVEYVKLLLDAEQRPSFVDLRPSDEFSRGRVPGARSLPLSELRRRYAEVPRTGLVILYCACPPEDVQAYLFLRDQGYRNITLMEEGFRGWVARGYPVEQ